MKDLTKGKIFNIDLRILRFRYFFRKLYLQALHTVLLDTRICRKFSWRTITLLQLVQRQRSVI